MTAPRITLVTCDVLDALLRLDGTERSYGAVLAREADRPSGTVYPVLQRMARCGWLTATQETEDPATLGRPQRIVYALTDTGRRAAMAGRSTFVLAATTDALRVLLRERLVELDDASGYHCRGLVTAVWHDEQRVLLRVAGREGAERVVLIDRERGPSLAHWGIRIVREGH